MNTTDAWKALVEPGAGALIVRDQSGFAVQSGTRNGDRVDSANGVALAIPADIPTHGTAAADPQPGRVARGKPRRQATALAVPECGCLSGMNAADAA